MTDSTTTVVPVATDTTSNETADPSKLSTPESIPYDRFQKVNEAKVKLETELTQYKAKAKAEAEELAKKNGEYEKLYNDNLSKITGYDELNTTLESILTSQLENIPEDKQRLIPKSFTAKQKLDYITENREVLFTAKTTVNHPVKQGEKQDGKIYHKASDISNPKYYLQHSADIKKAVNEGRIVD